MTTRRLLAAFHAWRINRRQADIRLIAFMERLSKATPGPWGHFVAEWRPAVIVTRTRTITYTEWETED